MKFNRDRFDELRQIFTEITHLRGTRRLLDWDQETYMPRKGQANRAEQNATLSRLIHQRVTAKRTGQLIEELFESAEPKSRDNDAYVCLRQWRRDYTRQKRLPTLLVEELSRQSVLAHEAWVRARKESNFSIFLPFFKTLVSLSRQKAEYLGFSQSPYDALLDEYEQGLTTKELEQLFSGLVSPLKALMQEICSRQGDVKSLKGSFPISGQKTLAQIAAVKIGFDMCAGRMDTVVHPFSTKIGPGDCRITSRWNRQDFTEGFFGILHEAGHGIYSQNLPSEWYGTPLGESVSLGIHESQSRFWENVIGRSRAFWSHFLPIAKGIFPDQLDSMELNEFVRIINKVEPSYIRVEADEVTYNLHVYLRFVIEKELIEGKLEPEDIPDRWNNLFKELMGLEVTKDTLGCLQDVHWSGASFGYFPTYTLGNIYAAMIREALLKEIPKMEEMVQEGSFEPILNWLNEKIHIQGQRFAPSELIRRVTGERPCPEPLIRYLKDKFVTLIPK